MRTKTFRIMFIIIVVILLLVSAFSFTVLLYLYTFERITLPVGLLYLFGLVPLPAGLLLSVDCTPLGLVWEGSLIISTNPDLSLTPNFLLIFPLTLAFVLSPIGLIMNLSGFSDYENLGEAIKVFKSRIWGERGKKNSNFHRNVFRNNLCLFIIYFIIGVLHNNSKYLSNNDTLFN